MLSLYYLITISAQSWEDYIFTSGVVWLIKLHYSDFYTHVQTRLMVGLTAHAPKWLETGKLNPTLKIPRKFLKVFLLVPMYHHYIWATVINWQKLMQTKFPYFLILKLSSNKDLQCPGVLYSTGHVFMLQNLRTSLKWRNCYSWRTKCILLFLLAELKIKISDLHLTTALNYWEVRGDSKMYCAVRYEYRTHLRLLLGLHLSIIIESDAWMQNTFFQLRENNLHYIYRYL